MPTTSDAVPLIGNWKQLLRITCYVTLFGDVTQPLNRDVTFHGVTT